MPTQAERIEELEQELVDLGEFVAHLQSQIWELAGRCPDCGGPLDEHTDDYAGLHVLN